MVEVNPVIELIIDPKDLAVICDALGVYKSEMDGVDLDEAIERARMLQRYFLDYL